MLNPNKVRYARSYHLQLINLGRILQEPKLLDQFDASDFVDYDVNKLIKALKSDMPRKFKDEALEHFMTRIGCSAWIAESKDRMTEMITSQKSQARMYHGVEAAKKASREKDAEKAIAIMKAFVDTNS